MEGRRVEFPLFEIASNPIVMPLKPLAKCPVCGFPTRNMTQHALGYEDEAHAALSVVEC